MIYLNALKFQIINLKCRMIADKYNMHTIDAHGLSKSYSKKLVVDNISLIVRTGEIIGLLGPNGAGKTTTFYMIVGLLKPDKGSILLDGEDIGYLPVYKRAIKGIGYLPQDASIFRRLTVYENIAAVFEIRGMDKRQIMSETETLIEEFNLESFSSQRGDALSGGQRRRAEIARAVAIDPFFLLFDEPFAGIDPIAVSELKQTLMYLKNSKNIGILITDHNVRETLSITDRAYIINNGSILDMGTPELIAGNVKVRDAYLGKEFKL